MRTLLVHLHLIGTFHSNIQRIEYMNSNRMLHLVAFALLSSAPYLTAHADNGGTVTSNGLGQGSPNGPMPGTSPAPAAQKSQYGQGAPQSSLSPNAMTPRANPQGVGAYTISVKSGQAPANSGALNPNNPR
jgi:hypothetical protein